MLNDAIAYAKHVNAPEGTEKWLTIRLKKVSPTQQEVEHVIDWIANDTGKKANWSRSNFNDALVSANKWSDSMAKKAKAVVESKNDTELVKKISGYRLVKLVGENAYKREGYLMSNCVASYYGKSPVIYSLRDKDNMPHCTMEVAGSDSVRQVKGKGNGPIHPKYIDVVVKALKAIGYTVTGSDMKLLGYVNVSELKCFKCPSKVLFQGKWVPKRNLDQMVIKKNVSAEDATSDFVCLLGY